MNRAFRRSFKVILVVLLALGIGFSSSLFSAIAAPVFLGRANEAFSAWLNEANALKASEANIQSDDNWQYVIVQDQYAFVIGYNGQLQANCSIPGKLGGCYVAGIANGALVTHNELETIMIPGHVGAIDTDAFPAGVTLKSYNGSSAMRYASKHKFSFMNMSEFDFYPGVVDFSGIDPSQYKIISKSEVWLSTLQASRLNVGDSFWLVNESDRFAVAYYKVASMEQRSGDFVVVSCTTPGTGDIFKTLRMENLDLFIQDGNQQPQFTARGIDDIADQTFSVPRTRYKQKFNVDFNGFNGIFSLTLDGELTISAKADVTKEGNKISANLFLTLEEENKITANISGKASSLNHPMYDYQLAVGKLEKVSIAEILAYKKLIDDVRYRQYSTFVSRRLGYVKLFSFYGILECKIQLGAQASFNAKMGVSWKNKQQLTFHYNDGKMTQECETSSSGLSLSDAGGTAKIGITLSISQDFLQIINLVKFSLFAGVKLSANLPYLTSDDNSPAAINMLDCVQLKAQILVEGSFNMFQVNASGFGGTASSSTDALINGKVQLFSKDIAVFHFHLGEKAIKQMNGHVELSTKNKFHRESDCPYDDFYYLHIKGSSGADLVPMAHYFAGDQVDLPSMNDDETKIGSWTVYKDGGETAIILNTTIFVMPDCETWLIAQSKESIAIKWDPNHGDEPIHVTIVKKGDDILPPPMDIQDEEYEFVGWTYYDYGEQPATFPWTTDKNSFSQYSFKGRWQKKSVIEPIKQSPVPLVQGLGFCSTHSDSHWRATVVQRSPNFPDNAYYSDDVVNPSNFAATHQIQIINDCGIVDLTLSDGYENLGLQERCSLGLSDTSVVCLPEKVYLKGNSFFAGDHYVQRFYEFTVGNMIGCNVVLGTIKYTEKTKQLNPAVLDLCKTLDLSLASDISIPDRFFYENSEIVGLDTRKYIDWSGRQYPWRPYSGQHRLQKVIFPEKLSRIGYGFFAGSNIKEVVIPATVIGDGAFEKCTKLKKVIITGQGVTIGKLAFSNCQNLQQVAFNFTKVIGPEAFSGCSSLEVVQFKEGLRRIESRAFGNTGLERIDIPGTMDYIGEYGIVCNNITVDARELAQNSLRAHVFLGQDNRSRPHPDSVIRLGEHVEKIAEDALYAEKIYMGSNVKQIDRKLSSWGKYILPQIECNTAFLLSKLGNAYQLQDKGFQYIYLFDEGKDQKIGIKVRGNEQTEWPQIEKLAIVNGVTHVGNLVCGRPNPDPEESNMDIYPEPTIWMVVLPDTVVSVDSSAFWHMDQLESIKLSSGMKEIGDFPSWITHLKSITIPNSVETISGGAFSGCSELTEVILPDHPFRIKKDSWGEKNPFQNAPLNYLKIPNGWSGYPLSEFGRLSCDTLEFEEGYRFNMADKSWDGLEANQIIFPDSAINLPTLEFATGATLIRLSDRVVSIASNNNGGPWFGDNNIFHTKKFNEVIADYVLEHGGTYLYDDDSMFTVTGWGRIPGSFRLTKVFEQKYRIGSPVIQTPASLPVGVKILEWYKDESFTTPITEKDIVKKSMNVYVTLESNLFTLSYILVDGDSETVMMTQQVAAGSVPDYPQKSPKADYALIGWYRNKDLSGACFHGVFRMPQENTKLYGRLMRLPDIMDFAESGEQVTLSALKLDNPDITNLEIPDYYDNKKVTAISDGVLSEVSSQNVTLPKYLETVTPQALSNQYIRRFIIDESAEHFKTVDGVLYTKDMKKLVRYPDGADASTFTVPSGVTTICTGAFSNPYLYEINLPDSVTTLQANALSGCEFLRIISAYGLTSLGNNCLPKNEFYMELKGKVGGGAFRDYCESNGLIQFYNHYDLMLFMDGKLMVETTAEAGFPIKTDILHFLNTKDTVIRNWYPSGNEDVAWDPINDMMPEHSLSLYGWSVPVYTYRSTSVKGQEGLMLTAYYGTATHISIPEVIDNKPVIAISSGFFAENTVEVDSVTIGPNVIMIESGAFTAPAQYPFAGHIYGDEGTYVSSWAEQNGFIFMLNDYRLSFVTYGKPIGEQTSPKGTVIKLPTPIKDGCVFDGWYLDQQLNNGVALNEQGLFVMPANHVVLYACWSGEGVELPFTWTGTTEYTITSYTGTESDVVLTIPASINSVPVTAIGENAFANCDSISGIIMPNTILSIDQNAFSNCQNLTKVVIGSGVRQIAFNAFENCPNLVDLSVDGTGFYRVEEGMLCSHTGILVFYPEGLQAEKVIVPSDIKEIGRQAFRNAKFEQITLPDSVLTIGKHAFEGCINLRKVITSPETKLSSIGDFAFERCSKLEDFHLLTQDIDMGMLPFEPLGRRLTIIGYSGGSVEKYAVEHNHTFVEYVVPLPENVGGIFGTIDATWELTTEGVLTIKGSGKLSSEEIPWNIYRMHIRSIVFDAQGKDLYIEKINPNSFTGLPNLESIQIGNYVTWKYYTPETPQYTGTFENCKKLSSVKFPTAPRFIIPSGMFRNCVSLKQIELGSSVMGIYAQAFTGSGLRRIEIPASLGSYGSAFKDCLELREVVFEEGCSAVNGSFSGCVNLSKITLPSSLNTIGNSAFKNTGLVQVDLSSVSSIGYYAFASCKNLEKIIFSPQMTTFACDYVWDCPRLTTIQIPDGVSKLYTIERMGVSDYKGGLINIQVSDTHPLYTSIDGVLYTKDCKKLVWYPTARTTTTILEGTQIIGYGSFAHAHVPQVILPVSIKHVQEYAFYQCKSLKKMTIHRGVTSMGKSALPVQLEEVVFDGTCEEWHDVSIECYRNGTYGATFNPSIHISNFSKHVQGKGQGRAPTYTQTGEKPSVVCVVCGTCIQVGNIIPTIPTAYQMTLPKAVMTVQDNAFAGNDLMYSVSLPVGCTTIGHNAFTGCEQLQFISIPNGDCSIAYDAFDRDSCIVIITVPESPVAKWAVQNGYLVADINP